MSTTNSTTITENESLARELLVGASEQSIRRSFDTYVRRAERQCHHVFEIDLLQERRQKIFGNENFFIDIEPFGSLLGINVTLVCLRIIVYVQPFTESNPIPNDSVDFPTETSNCV